MPLRFIVWRPAATAAWTSYLKGQHAPPSPLHQGAQLPTGPDLRRYATAAELFVLPAVNRERIQPTDFDHASRLFGQALTAERAAIGVAPVVESVAA